MNSKMLEKINERLQRDYNTITNKYGLECVGVFVYGSQNYNLDTPTSDIDTKAIVIPSVKDIIFTSGEIKKQIEWEDGICDIHDMVSMHKSFKKQNINFLEILFTEYKFINPEYEHLYDPMFKNNEKIAHISPYRALQANYGTLKNKLSKLLEAKPSNFETVTKYGYDNKALCDIFRISEFIERYKYGIPFSDCLVSPNRESLYEIKCNPQKYTSYEASKFYSEYTDSVKAELEELDQLMTDEDTVWETIDLVDWVTENCYTYYLKQRLVKNIG